MEFYSGPSLEFSEEKKKFSRVGLALFVLVAGSSAVSLAIALIWKYAVQLPPPSWLNFAVTIFSLYICAAPFAYWIMRTTPKVEPVKRRISFGEIVSLICIAISFMMLGSYIGSIVNRGVTLLTGIPQSSAITNALRSSDLWLSVLYTGLIAPIFEELFFRKFLMDRLRGVGDGLMIMTSGVFFGLFHGNLDQFFYSVLLGFLLAYVYHISGKIRYCIIIHSAVNFIGGLIPTAAEFFYRWMAERAANELVLSLVSLIPLAAMLLMYIPALVGAFLLFIRGRRWQYNLSGGTVPRGMGIRVAIGNIGGALFAAVCIYEIIFSIFV